MLEFNGNRLIIPYNELQNIRILNEGGFGKIYQAIWVNKLGVERKVALKYLKSSKGYSIDIVNELISFEITRFDNYILHYYGLTLTEYSRSQKIYIVMEYAEGGNLSDSQSESYKDILWQKRLARLQSIIIGPTVTAPKTGAILIIASASLSPSKRNLGIHGHLGGITILQSSGLIILTRLEYYLKVS
ncbi:19014_t:CDS:2 [Dentiscutata erythropus]|uniref:19014_t:CDS:1 n=1 Tax=Dentiscutata erythropus TaxID=1348616 RepID=A0A9N8Z3J7_9GLOM|nr:19014_t:CDS:2 [Dentiscutata erythropus]